MPELMINRRRLIETSLLAGTGLLAPAVLRLDTAPASDGFIVLRAGKAEASLLGEGEAKTPIWTYNGVTPGPTLRARRGDVMRVRLVNELDQPTTIHWHGIRIANAMDGVAGMTQEPVPPGGTFDYVFEVPDAGTFWYHTHNRSWEQLARGLYGLLIVEEPEPYPVDRELQLVFDDWSLTREGKINEETLGNLHDWAHRGRLGNWLTVNGTSAPAIPVSSGERLRLRLANTANARVLSFDFPGHEPWLISLDGHPVSPRKLEDGRIELAPAQRADLVLDARLEPGSTGEIREVGNGDPYKAASFTYWENQTVEKRHRGDPRPLPSQWGLRNPDLANARKVELEMGGGAMGRMDKAVLNGETMGWRELVGNRRVWAFNGIAGDMDKPLTRVRRGDTIAIRMANNTAWQHAMHLHGHHFTTTELNDKRVEKIEWRDTVLMEPDETRTIAFVADNPGKWLLHCHMVEHMAAGMNTWIHVKS